MPTIGDRIFFGFMGAVFGALAGFTSTVLLIIVLSIAVEVTGISSSWLKYLFVVMPFAGMVFFGFECAKEGHA